MNQSLWRYWVLIMLGCALSLAAPTGHASNDEPVIRPAFVFPSPTVSPSPEPTPSNEEKRPSAVRRFFSWSIDQVTRPFKKEPRFVCRLPPLVDVRVSKSLITFCPKRENSTTSASCSPDREVKLVASILNRDADDQFLFTWAVTSGTIRGEGREVSWNLNGVAEGTYTATVEVNDGNQLTSNSSVTVTVAICSGCDGPPPPCPSVSVSCPIGIDNQPITFEAIVTGGEPEMQPTYTWSISAGKIISGQGTSKLIVDRSDRGGRSIIATVSIGGAHPACAVPLASCAFTH
jgi:hypothetical protein